METKHLAAFAITITGLCLGFIGKFLFMGFGYGINLSVFIMLLIGSMIFYRYLFNYTLSTYQKILTGLGLLFALCLGIYSSEYLFFFNCLALFILSLMGLSVSESMNNYVLKVTTLLSKIISIIVSPFQAIFTLTADIIGPSKKVMSGKHTLSVFSGLLWATPLLFVFGNLLASSDQRFKILLNSLLVFDISHLSESFISVTAWTIISTTFLFQAIVNRNKAKHRHSPELNTAHRTTRTDGVQLITVLSCINILFSSYIAVQFSYFFGGDALVQNTHGITYSSYANKGFWDLVFVAMIAIPVLYVINFLDDHNSAGMKKWVKLLSLFTLCAVGLMEASAAHRMYIYIREYNLTETRFYSTWFMCFIVSALLFFGLTAMREQRQYFISCLCFSALAFIAALNLINPDACIARSNLLRALDKQPLDYDYLQQLSYDAYPEILSFFAKNNAFDTCRFLTVKTTQHMDGKIIEHRERLSNIHKLENIGGKDWQELAIANYMASTALKKLDMDTRCPDN